jgi:hypothetical protein
MCPLFFRTCARVIEGVGAGTQDSLYIAVQAVQMLSKSPRSYLKTTGSIKAIVNEDTICLSLVFDLELLSQDDERDLKAELSVSSNVRQEHGHRSSRSMAQSPSASLINMSI